MSLLREIQDAAIDANTDISVVLRRCKVLAVRLGNKEFESWVDKELNGYASNKELPEYRILKDVDSYGNFVGLTKQLSGASIAPSLIPEEYRDLVTTMYFTEPISYYSSIVAKGTKKEDGQLISAWSGDLIALVDSKIYVDMICFGAWRQLSEGSFAALLDTIRNRILNFVLEIEKEAPDAGETSPDKSQISPEKVTQVFNTIISGNVQNVATGSTHFSQSGEFSVVQGDIESLKKYLSTLGIAEEDLTELESAVKEDQNSGNQKGIGKKVTDWMSGMISKAGSGVWKVSVSVAANVIGKAIAKYYGLD